MSSPDENPLDTGGRITTYTYCPDDPDCAGGLAGVGGEGAGDCGPAADLLWTGEAEGNAAPFRYEGRDLPLNHSTTFTYAYRPTGRTEEPPPG